MPQVDVEELKKKYSTEEPETPEQQEKPIEQNSEEPQKKLSVSDLMAKYSTEGPDIEKPKESKKKKKVEEETSFWQKALDTAKNYPGAVVHGLGTVKKGIQEAVTFGAIDLIPSKFTREVDGKKETIDLGIHKNREDSNVLYMLGQGIGSAITLGPVYGVGKKAGQDFILATAKSPLVRKSANALSSLIGGATMGITDTVVRDAMKGKVTSVDDIVKHGASWAAIDAALQVLVKGAVFAKNLWKTVAKGKTPVEVLNQVSQKVKGYIEKEGMSIGEASLRAVEEVEANTIVPKDLRSRKITNEPLDRIHRNAAEMAEEIHPQSVESTVDSLVDENISERINNSWERASSKRELGLTVQEEINRGFESLTESANPVYQKARFQAKDINHRPVSTANEIMRLMNELESIKLRPSDYGSTIRHLKTALKDIGYGIFKNKKTKVKRVKFKNEISAEQLMEVKKRVNEIVDYESITPTVKNTLKLVAKEARKDIGKALKEHPETLKLYEEAEGIHANKSQTYGRKAINKIRSSQNGDSIAKMIENPSVLSDVLPLVSSDTRNKIERELLESLNKLSYQRGKDKLREWDKYFNYENKKLARSIVDSKIKIHSPLRTRSIEDSIIGELSNSLSTGLRPSRVMRMWQNEKGRNLVLDSLEGNPNKKDLVKYLQDQSSNDLFKSIVSDTGKIDFVKLKEMLKNPSVLKDLEAVGGPQSIQFLRELERRAAQIEKNIEVMGKRFPASAKQGQREAGERILQKVAKKEEPIKNFLINTAEHLGLTGEKFKHFITAMHVFGMMTSPLKYPLAVVAQKLLYKAAVSKPVRDSYLMMLKANTNTEKFTTALQGFIDSLDNRQKE